MKRRKFLQLTSLTATSLSIQSLSEVFDKDQPIYSFPQMVGEVSQTSAILQTRLAARNTHPKGSYDSAEAIVSQDVAGVAGVTRFEIAETSRFGKRRETPWQSASSDQDYIVKHKIKGLKPGTRYYVHVRFGPSEDQTRTGPVNQFSTLPAKDSEEPVFFVVSSCFDEGHFYLGRNFSPGHRGGHSGHNPKEWQKPIKGRDRELGYPALEAMRNLQPSFWVQTGDTVYYDHPHAAEAKTKKELRAKWHRQMAFPRWQRLLQEVPVYFMKDDHDFRYNDSDNSKNGKEPSAALGKAIFREQVPVVDPTEHNSVTYRTRRVNKHLQIWMMEGRDYRDPNKMPDGPKKSLWGKEQLQWLKDTLLASEATFKLLIAGTCLVGPSSASQKDNHTNAFRHERDIFFRWLKAHDFQKKNFYMIAGDQHWQRHTIHPLGFEEFCTGTADTRSYTTGRHGREAGDAKSTDPLGMITQPYIQQKPVGGFLSVQVDPPQGDNAALITFTMVDENGNKLYIDYKRAVS